jgi:hypothetical protein
MAVYDKDGNILIQPIVKEPKKKGGKGPRASGNRVEKIVARNLGGERTIGSGAFKNTNHNLTGDVEVYDNEKQPFIKLEVKASGAITATGEKSFVMKRSVLDQMVQEADDAHELGAMFLHFKGQSVEDGFVIMVNRHWKEILELAKLGRTVLKGK